MPAVEVKTQTYTDEEDGTTIIKFYLGKDIIIEVATPEANPSDEFEHPIVVCTCGVYRCEHWPFIKDQYLKIRGESKSRIL
jgi:hypothetical protein